MLRRSLQPITIPPQPAVQHQRISAIGQRRSVAARHDFARGHLRADRREPDDVREEHRHRLVALLHAAARAQVLDDVRREHVLQDRELRAAGVCCAGAIRSEKERLLLGGFEFYLSVRHSCAELRTQLRR